MDAVEFLISSPLAIVWANVLVLLVFATIIQVSCFKFERKPKPQNKTNGEEQSNFDASAYHKPALNQQPTVVANQKPPTNPKDNKLFRNLNPNAIVPLEMNLRLAKRMLQLYQKKKAIRCKNTRAKIASLLLANQHERARIQTESVIRDDYVIEAYEILETYCDLLLARFGFIMRAKNLDDGVAEAIASVLWVAPRISHEIGELKIISKQLEKKYGHKFVEAAQANELPAPACVSPRLIQKLTANIPSRFLIEKYLSEIAKEVGIDFKPDQKLINSMKTAVSAESPVHFRNSIAHSMTATGSKSYDDELVSVYYPTQSSPCWERQKKTASVSKNTNVFSWGHNTSTMPPQGSSLQSAGPFSNYQRLSNKQTLPLQPTIRNLIAPAVITGTMSPKTCHRTLYDNPNENKNFEIKFPEPSADADNDFKTSNSFGVGEVNDKSFDELVERFRRLTKKT